MSLVSAAFSCFFDSRFRRPAFRSCLTAWLLLACIGIIDGQRTIAADFDEVRQAFYAGNYQACIQATREEVDKGIWNDFWSRQLIRCLLTVGEYEEAREVYDSVSSKFSNSLPLRVLGAQAYRFCGDVTEGDRLLDEIPALISNAPWRYSDRENLLALGQFLLTQGEDARYILESCYDRILKSDPEYVDAYIAIAELALDKADSQEAVRSLEKALELRPEDPYVSYLLAKAWSSSDGEKATAFLKAALDLNAKHVPSLLMQVAELVDSEQYDAAEEMLELVFDVNAENPDGWALKAAIAHLRGEYLQEGEFRSRGLQGWSTNPAVDFAIGETLSRHYRFAEGVTYQRRALKLDPDFLPAKFQLAQDLLRVGQEDEGWNIVSEVAEADKYNVVAFNLRTLQDRLSQFTTLEAPGFIVRMDAQEAQIYGPRVLQLLQAAKAELCEKYDMELLRPTTVEIFPQQSDFAIRTFGLPGGAGYLGVCFGSLITANSPASQGESPSNWESVLWHEFCHVVTLQKTNNRMPRWLSEGISVYEEVEKDASWGQTMTPQYKAMLEGEDYVPLSQLSRAFMSPKSPLHLQFAYYESSLAVRYLIEQHGLPLMRKLLDDLGMGVSADDAFADRYGDPAALDRDFKQWIEQQTEAFLPTTSFDREDLPQRPSEEGLRSFVEANPDNYVARSQLTQVLMQTGKWQAALESVKQLQQLYPGDAAPGGALDLQARILRELGEHEQELDVLRDLLTKSPDNVPALLRIQTLARENQDWELLLKYSEVLLAVQPLIPEGHEGLADAAEQLALPEKTLGPLQALQEMDPLDPSGTHFQLAKNLMAVGNREAARREVLLALEYSPRYREAQQLLVAIHENRPYNAQAETDAPADQAEAADANPDDQTSLDLTVTPPVSGRAPKPARPRDLQ